MKTRSLKSQERSRSRSRTPLAKAPKKSNSKKPQKISKSIEKTPEKVVMGKTPEKVVLSEESEGNEHELAQNSQMNIPKTSNSVKKKSYLDIIKEYIDKFDASNIVQEKSSNFTLMEDLKIIYEMAKDKENEESSYLSNFWRNLSNGIIARNVESIRTRYKNYLKFLEKEDFDKIIEHLKEKGTKGYVMKFTVIEKNKRKFSGIISEENGKSTSTIKRNEENVNVSSNIDNNTKNLEQKKKEDVANKLNLHDHILIKHIKKYETLLKSNKLLVEGVWKSQPKIYDFDEVLNEEKKDDEVNETKNIMITTNFEKRIVSCQSELSKQESSLKNLELSMDKLTLKHNVTKDYLIELLTTVSGDIKDLELLLENSGNKDSLVWTSEDDEILEKCTEKNDSGFKLLKKYKGDERIRKRLAFLNINLPFEF